MGRIVLAKDVHETIEVMGEWSIDGEVGNRFGVLSYSPTKVALLKVFSIVKTEGPCRIVGRQEGGHCVTVFDAFGSGLQGNLMSPETCVTEFAFSSFWVGPYGFRSKDDARFKSVSFGINGLEGWYIRQSFDFNQDEKDYSQIEIKYKRPDEVMLFEDNLVTIKIGYAFHTSGFSLAQSKAEIVQTPRIVINAKNGKLPYYGGKNSFEFYVEFIHSFIGLLIGNDAFMYDLKCVAEPMKFDAEKKQPRQLEILFEYRWSRELPAMVHSDPLSVIVPFEDGGKIVNAAKVFWGCFAKFGELFECMLMYTYKWRTITEHTLPEMVFLFEGMSKMLYLDECRAEKKSRVVASGDWDKIEEIKALTLERGDKKLSEMASRLFSEDPSLRDMMTVIFNKTREALPILKDDKTRGHLMTYLCKRRHGTAHSGKEERMSIQLDIWCTKFLLMDMLAMILLYCGFSEDIIRAHYVRPFTGYNYLCELLPKELAKVLDDGGQKSAK